MQITQHRNYFKIAFNAMASPCEILLFSDSHNLVKVVAKIAIDETKRFENKFSRYLYNNLCWQINRSEGKKVKIDLETFNLLEYANNLYQMSEKLFDITAGVLNKIWHFKKDAHPPSQSSIDELLPFIGFHQIDYAKKYFCMPKGMQVDFGGIGKEYIVDRVAQLITPICEPEEVSFLVNFGGDLVAKNFNSLHPAWHVGVENIESHRCSEKLINISQGAVATSGSTKRFFDYQGQRYAHILNPITGKPVMGAPRSVSVFAGNCSLAGGMSSLAQLQGKNAEIFLKNAEVEYLCYW